MSDTNPYGTSDANQQGAPQGYGPPQPQGYPHPGAAPGPGYPPPGMYAPNPDAPYGYDHLGRVYSDKSKIVAGVLQLTLGGFGIGRFYAGSVGVGIAQLFTCGGFGVWALIDGILYLVGNDRTDKQGRVLRG